MRTSTMTIRLDDGLKTRLENLATATHRKKSFLAAEAIATYIKLQEWQIGEIQQGIIEANSDNVVSHEKVLKRWANKNAN